jgi:hypothetical protein
LAHIFDKTDGYFKDKIFKFSFFGDNINTIKNNKIKNTIANTKDNTKDDMVANTKVNTKDDTIGDTIENTKVNTQVNNNMHYYCNSCSYYTLQLYHFKRHLKSKSHSKISNIVWNITMDCNIYKKKLYICKNCKKMYTSNRSLENHKIKCSKDIIIDEIMNNLKNKFKKKMQNNNI